MGRAPPVGEVFFPLDEELGLLPGNLAPRQQEHLVHLACFMPFDKAAEMLEAILSVRTNEETARQRTEYMGARMQAVQTAEVTPCSQEGQEEQAPHRCVISSDGAMVSLVQKQWAEVRTLAIGEPQEKRNAQQEKEIHVGKLSYFSRLADASSFIDLAEVEMRRRQVREAKQVCAVTDGADWCQSLTERYRPDAVRILDFPHAAEYVSLLLEGLEKGKVLFPPQMLERCLHILKHRGPRPLLCLADRHLRPSTQQERRRKLPLGVPTQTRGVDAVSSVSTPGLASGFRDGREREQKRGRSTSQRNGDALGTQPYQSHARVTQCGL